MQAVGRVQCSNSRFALTAHTAILAGGVVYDVFPNVEAFQALEVLSILSESESNYTLTPIWPRLDMVLADATNKFPNLQKLHMNSFYDCLPVVPVSASFSHLSTLVLDGSREDEFTYPALIAAFLNCTPQLESLWTKHDFWRNPNLYDVTPQGRLGSDISLDIRLPRLRHLAVSVPGTACDLIGCITAPMVEDLHLDDSRKPEYKGGKQLDDPWEREDTATVRKALRLFASRCQSVRRFAVTQAYLSRNVWDWIMFGEDERGPPFPMLECIALHGIFDAAWSLRVNRVYRSRGLFCCTATFHCMRLRWWRPFEQAGQKSWNVMSMFRSGRWMSGSSWKNLACL